MTRPGWFAGLMTGTVLDGQIDIAFLRTDGDSIMEFGPAKMVPYPDEVRTVIAEAVTAAQAWNFDGDEPAIFVTAESALTHAQAHAVIETAQAYALSLDQVIAIGFHGQTVLHRPPTQTRTGPTGIGRTRQLGDGALMAGLIGRPVVFDFRSGDMAAGGHGAPLCPSYHAALLNRVGADETVAVLNLGGVGNITWQSQDGQLVAFDTGPANAPIDDWIRRHGAGDMDEDGHIAASGNLDRDRLATLMNQSYFLDMPPKSLDRNDFTASIANGLSLADGAALLTALAAASVARAVEMLPTRVERLIVCGGGRHNPVLLRLIAEMARVAIDPADEYGWRGDTVEAECFAFLAARHLAGLPVSYPGTTGVPSQMSAGRFAAPSASARLTRAGETL
jgi:anhydro-N-acetylmuramic acid kinase